MDDLDLGLKLTAPLVKEPTKRVLDMILQEIYEGGKFAKAYIRARTSEPAIDRFAQNISRYALIRPLWGGRDHQVDIRDIYSPLRIRLERDAKSVQIDNLSEIDVARNLLLIGTVGQGKSTLIRHLCVKQIERLAKGRDHRLPILVELRNLRQGKTIENLLTEEFRRLGFGKVDRHLLSLYLKSGKFVLFFDGFDELHSSLADAVVMQLELVTSRYAKLQAIITSRPGSKIHKSLHFRPIYLDYLSPDQFRGFFLQLCRQTDPQNFLMKADSLLHHLDQSEFGISALLRTPLLLTLYWLSMRKGDPSPKNEAEFFARLFDTLFFSHDSAKDVEDAINFVREKYSGLDYTEMRRMFEAVSYRISQENHANATSLPYFAFATHVREVEKFVSPSTKVHPDRFAEDIERITNLIHMENQEIHYVHKSVLDFYSAAFISQRDQAFLQSFYNRHLNYGTSQTFPEGRFLGLIGELDYNRFFFAPLVSILRDRLGVPPTKHNQFHAKLIAELEALWTFGLELHTDKELNIEIFEVQFQQPSIVATTFFDRDLWLQIERDVLPHVARSIPLEKVSDTWVRKFVVGPRSYRSSRSFLQAYRMSKARLDARSGTRSLQETQPSEFQISAMRFLRANRGAGQRRRDIGVEVLRCVSDEVTRLVNEAKRLERIAAREASVASWI